MHVERSPSKGAGKNTVVVKRVPGLCWSVNECVKVLLRTANRPAPHRIQVNRCTLKCFSSLYQSGIDFKCPYSNRTLKPFTLLVGSPQSLFSGT